MSASSLQKISEAGFPANGTQRQKMAFVIKYAMLAPTEIDWQPWEFRLTDSHIELMARNEPNLNSMDPEGRELMISCGSALLYLKLGLRHFGCLGRVELFPELARPTLAARISFGFGCERAAQDRVLFEATMRNPPDFPNEEESPIPSSALAAIRDAVTRERGWVEFAQSESSRRRLIGLAFPVQDSSGVGHLTVASVASTEPMDSKLTASGGRLPRQGRAFLGFKIGRSETEDPVVQSEQRPPIPGATLAVVKTKTDDKRGWLAAGHAMARIILQAQALGLSWSFFNHAVRRRHGREALRTGLGHKGFAQVILRLCSTSSANSFSPASLAIRPTVFGW